MSVKPAKARLTKTQKIILQVMDAHDGKVIFGAGDRKGTRIFGYAAETGLPIIKAYSNPEIWLKARGLIEPAGGNYTRFVYKITPAGRSALAAAGISP